nr:NADPH-dependent FMN reductase [Sphingomonas sp. CDS-1]
MTTKFIVALGGTLRSGSSTEAAMRHVLRHAESQGARTRIFTGEEINLPMYAPGNVAHTPRISELIAALREADGVILGSPGYHGGVSGLVKNAIDYTEEMAKDARPYFSGKAVGCIASGAGFQGCNATLNALRGIVHALRGWPTPLGIAFNSAGRIFDGQGHCLLPELDNQFAIMANDLIAFGV